MLRHRRRFLERFAAIVLPGAGEGMPPPDALGTVDAIDRYLARLHPVVRLGFVTLVDGVNVLPLSRGFRAPFARLSDDDARRFLEEIERSRIYAVRNAFTGVKALVMLHYYGDTAVETKLGYADDCLAP